MESSEPVHKLISEFTIYLLRLGKLVSKQSFFMSGLIKITFEEIDAICLQNPAGMIAEIEKTFGHYLRKGNNIKYVENGKAILISNEEKFNDWIEGLRNKKWMHY